MRHRKRPRARADQPAVRPRQAHPGAPYDDVWEGFDVTRVSQTSGLLCLSGDGHGFFLSRERWKLF